MGRVLGDFASNVLLFGRTIRRPAAVALGARNIWIDTCPGRRLGCPNGRCRAAQFRVIERAAPNEDQVGSGFGFAEQLGATGRAEVSVHHVAAVGTLR
jgi:hypothetical protein